MKKKNLLIICFTLLLVLVIIIFLKDGIKPTISYNKSMLFDNQNDFETVATVCMEYHKKNAGTAADEIWLYTVDKNANNLVCCHNWQYYSLTHEQKQAFIKVKSVFKLDHQGLEYLYVNNDFVVFGIINGRASIIYSPYNKKPYFVNSPKFDDDDIFVEKITNNWFYACRQS